MEDKVANSSRPRDGGMGTLSPEEKTALWMKRFRGRPDVFARKWYDKETGKGNYSPVCSKFWSPGCHIKLKDGVSCAKCEIRQMTPVGHETVLKHLQGYEEHSIYVVPEDGMIYFGAIDFDCKPNRDPKHSYYFEEVKRVSEACDRLGIKHAIARSTTDGFHLYTFFDKPYSAGKYIAVMRELVFEQSGLMELSRQGLKSLPELFPKQTSPGGEGGLGNPIKPPMIETRWDVERNCWVNNENIMIPADQQWEYFSKIPNNTAEIFDQLIDDYGLKITEEKVIVTSGGKFVRVGGGSYNKETGEWLPPTNGSMEKLISGCGAFRRLRGKMDTGYQPGHDEGFALFHCGALHTQDGMKYFEDGKVPGWGHSDKDKKQLMQSVDKNYSPWTCRKMQEKGICIPGTKCFDKKAPTEIIQGQKVIRDDLPESEWPDPSPIRYAVGEGEEFLVKLVAEIDALDAETDEAKKGVKIREIAARAQVFDKDQQILLKQHIEKKGHMKKRDLNNLFKQAEKEKTEELTKIASSRSDVRNVNGILYRKVKPYGYEVSRKVKGDAEGFTKVANFDMVIHEIREVIDDDQLGIKSAFYRGSFVGDGVKRPFEIPSDDFFDNSDLFRFIGKALHTRAGIQKPDMDDFRSAILAFSTGCRHVAYRPSPGWYEGGYAMPSVFIDADGVRANDVVPVEIPERVLQFFDFKLVKEVDLRELLKHIKKDFLQAFPKGPLLVLMGHVVLAFAARKLGIKKKPTVWLEGGTGEGKSDLLHSAQNFYGDFPSLLSWTSTGLGMRAMSNRAKDALLAVDDYKDLPGQMKAALEFIQYSYDAAERAALTKDAKLREAVVPEATNAASGEQIPTGHASVLGRMIIVPSEEFDMASTRPHYDEVIRRRGEYCAITPHLIHFFIKSDIEILNREIAETVACLENGFERVVNGIRICKHLAQNYVCTALFIRFLVHYGAMEERESGEWLGRHLEYLKTIRDQMAVDVSDENDPDIFVSTLMELLESGAVDLLLPGGTALLNGVGHAVIGRVTAKFDAVEFFVTLTKERVVQKLGPAYERLRGNTIAKRLRKNGFVSQESTPKIKREDKTASTKSWRVPLDRLSADLQNRIRLPKTAGRPLQVVQNPLPSMDPLQLPLSVAEPEREDGIV